MRAWTVLGLAAAVGASAGGACVRPVFECLTADNCISRGVQGVCEATGFCSYPDGECPSGQRYDEFAGDGLADSCVPETDDTTSSSGGSGSSEGSESSDTSGSSTDSGGCIPVDCVDADGDGWGAGTDCLGPDCDDDNAAHHDRCVYVSPDGDDEAGTGAIDAPWGTIATGLAALEPGRTLVLLDGVYEPSTTGLLGITCGEGGSAVDGTPEQPISVRAANERAAELRGDGITSPVYVSSCNSWRIHGVYAHGLDQTNGEYGGAEAVSVSESHDIVFKRLLLTHNNRWYNSNLMSIGSSTDVLVEEAEAYYYHRAAFLVWNFSERITFRRCYANSRGHEDLPDCDGLQTGVYPYCSSTSDGGDNAFTIFRDVVDVAYENCISDGRNGSGFSVGNDSVGVSVRGSIVTGDVDYGVIASASQAGSSVVGTTVEDTLVIEPRWVGVYLRSTTDSRLAGLSVLRSADGGVRVDENGEPLCADISGGCTVAAERVLAQGNASYGISIGAEVGWGLDSCNAYGNGTDWPAEEEIADADGNIRTSLSVDSGIGTAVDQCAVYVPDGSPLDGAAADGNDIGATILYRVEGGPTDVPLWDPETGAFPCGAVVAGVNDEPSTSCIGVHSRLNVFTNGCAAPSGYGTPPACE
jgi:hypothetical protein